MIEQFIPIAAAILVGIAIGAILMDKLGRSELSAESAAQQEKLRRLYSDPDPVVGQTEGSSAAPAKRGPGRPKKTAA